MLPRSSWLTITPAPELREVSRRRSRAQPWRWRNSARQSVGCSRLHGPHTRWAWNTWDRRRRETAERLTQREYAHLVVLRLRRPTEVRQAFGVLAGAAGVHNSHDGAALGIKSVRSLKICTVWL